MMNPEPSFQMEMEKTGLQNNMIKAKFNFSEMKLIKNRKLYKLNTSKSSTVHEPSLTSDKALPSPTAANCFNRARHPAVEAQEMRSEPGGEAGGGEQKSAVPLPAAAMFECLLIRVIRPSILAVFALHSTYCLLCQHHLPILLTQ
ncbi:uncharacterized [Tachysurus ichikawai]